MHTKILMLDCDGVINCQRTTARHNGYIGIDPFMALLVNRICERTGAQIVLSSTWRLKKEDRDEVESFIFPKPIDITPNFVDLPYDTRRGYEIKDWLDRHPEVTKYAILDDNNDMLPEQQDNFFKTSWEIGLTEEIAKRVEEHLGYAEENKPV